MKKNERRKLNEKIKQLEERNKLLTEYILKQAAAIPNYNITPPTTYRPPLTLCDQIRFC